MGNSINRRREMLKDALPPTGTKEFQALSEMLEKKFSGNKKHDEFVKKSWEKVTKSMEAQFLSHCGLVTELSLRNYLTEFNHRAWNHGLRSMPLMFNIMEAFFIYRKPEVYFELIEEENYLISFFEFIDFITSKEFSEDINLIKDNITPNIIYNFNIHKDLETIRFKCDGGNEFLVAGISIIRHDNEITVLIVGGRQKNDDDNLEDEEIDFSLVIKEKSDLIEDFKKNHDAKNYDYVYIDENNKYVKILISARIDLETMTIDSRYIAEETTSNFRIFTDNPEGFKDSVGNFISVDIEDAFNEAQKEIKNSNAIFEVLKSSLYLPFYFNKNEEKIIEENIDTEFKAINSNPISKRKYRDVFGYKASTKPLYSLNANEIFSPDRISIRDDLFKVQSNGYWKNLKLDEIGLDKNGNPIHGRTWVNETLSWFEASEEDLIITKDIEKFDNKNAGYIYILRNPGMANNLYKIGLTRNDVDERARQLYKTSVPDKFLKCQEWYVKDCIKAEKQIHDKLSLYRVNPKREFFDIEYSKAVEIIGEVIKQINAN